MKYAGVVLRNVGNEFTSVECAAVFDALLSAGVMLDEVVFLPYDRPSEVSASLTRLSLECEGIFLVCDRVLIASAKEAIAAAAEAPFEEEDVLETQRCLYAVLPAGERGAQIVRAAVVPRVDKRRHKRFSRVVVRTIAAPVETLRAAMQAAREACEGKLNLHMSEKYGAARIEVVYDQDTPKMIADEVLRILASTLGEAVYSVGDVSIEQRLCEALRLHRLKIATAESFTAGGVGQAIVSVPGASEVFYEALNTYDNKSKRERLGVSEFTLKSKGAVSDEVAYEMAAGLIADGNCDVAIATTGIAGPTSDYSKKPVGLCYFAVGTRERVRVFRYQLTGDRETITKTAVNLALYHAYCEIK